TVTQSPPENMRSLLLSSTALWKSSRGTESSAGGPSRQSFKNDPATGVYKGRQVSIDTVRLYPMKAQSLAAPPSPRGAASGGQVLETSGASYERLAWHAVYPHGGYHAPGIWRRVPRAG